MWHRLLGDVCQELPAPASGGWKPSTHSGKMPEPREKCKLSHYLFLGAFALLLVICGCGSAPDAAGKWTGKLETGSNVSEGDLEKASQVVGSVSLDLRKDKTYSMKMIVPIEGTWTQSGSTVSLQMTSFGGTSVAEAKKQLTAQGKTDAGQLDKPTTLRMGADGQTMTVENTAGQVGALTFTRDKTG